MANFILVVDPDLKRRSHFIQIVEPLLPPLAGLSTSSCTSGNFHASWAAHKNAPISWVADSQGAAVVWGEAIIPAQSTRIDAENLRVLWKESSYQGLPPFDGFYAAVAYHPHFGLVVAADLLGLFPIYYYILGEVALVASSPELFRYHPLFHAKFNPAGLVGILLTNGLIDGQTLWQDVRRLGAGHFLIWQPETSPKQVKQYQFFKASGNRASAQFSFEEGVELLDHLIDQALTRQAPKQGRYSLLLSGGLDSRMLAGFLHRQGVDTVALTLGKRTDIEMQCAISVARTLGFKHYLKTVPLEQYPTYAALGVNWEHLANGCNNIMRWSFPYYLGDLATKVVAGYSIEIVIGGKGLYTIPTQGLSFDTFFSCTNSWGFTPEQLEKLLRREVFGDTVQETLARIQEIYNSYSDIEFGRASCFDLYHRQRFHVGSVGWQLSFGAWPVLPILDLQLLETTATFPVHLIADRRSQNELVCTRFKQLAQLPLDRNSYDVEPLLKTQTRPSPILLSKLQRKWKQLQPKLGIERRYYYRIYDINNAGWRSVRQQAESYRQQVQHLFHEQVFNELIPPPNQVMKFNKDSITEASSRKALLGFLLWSKDRL